MLQYILDHFVISDDAKVTKKLLSCKYFGNFFATECVFYIFKERKKGISQSSVSQIINGNPTLDNLQEIASIIGIYVSELVREEGESPVTSLTCPHCGREIQIEIKPGS